MNDTAIKNFCVGACRDLTEQVRQRMADWDIRPGADRSAESVNGRLLSPREREQRARLLDALANEGVKALADRAAYTWFNRLMAIRYMELNDRIPCGVRVLSANDGTFAPQIIKDALQVDVEGIDRAEVLRLVQAADDEALFRYLLLAVCNSLAESMPGIFEPLGSEMELLLPKGLLRDGSVVQRLVQDIPEDDWRQGVEIVGWMYQYYVSERKDEVFASFKKGKKAEADAIAPATQLFTPEWIVQYLTQNSLGRLWVQSHPGSPLPQQMPYFIPDDLGAEGEPSPAPATPAPTVASPEDIRVIDPACGSGHILVYAFRLLAAMYEEAGYGRRDIPRLILEKNLTGCEIDPRASQIASFALTMTALDWDSRYLRRDNRATPDIVCLQPATLDEGELEAMPYLAERKGLLDAMAHMGECGSLFAPEPEDLEALRRAEAELADRAQQGDLFAYPAQQAITRMLQNCAPLAREYDAVISNPPYLGSRNMGRYLSGWLKMHYPYSFYDLYSAFIERGISLASIDGFVGVVAMQTWMFLSTFEKLRARVLNESRIVNCIHCGSQCFDLGQGEHTLVSVSAFVACRRTEKHYAFPAVRLVGIARNGKASTLRESISSESHPLMYLASLDVIEEIPGMPLAYWANQATGDAFCKGKSIDSFSDYTGAQNITANNEQYLRYFWEVSRKETGPSARWVCYTKGGFFRKWFGNLDYVVDWSDRARHFYETNSSSNLLSERYWFQEGITYTMLSQSGFSFRYMPEGCVFDKGGPGICKLGDRLNYSLAYLNSSVATAFFDILNPTLNLQTRDVKSIPVLLSEKMKGRIDLLTDCCMKISKDDWASSEEAFGFARHPLV